MSLFFTVLVSFSVAVLSGMGVGGGGLLMIALAFLTELPQLSAQGINLLFFLFSSGSSLIIHIQKRTLCFPAIAVMATAGVLGAWLGSCTAPNLSESLLRRIFGCILIVSGIVSLKKQTAKSSEPPSPS